MSPKQQIVFDKLKEMQIEYQVVNHPAAYTIEEMEVLGLEHINSVAKNLFLRDEKGRRHFLVVLQKDKQADLKTLREKLGSSRLSFASEQRLQKYLGIEKGSVTPFGVLNDQECAVEVVFDRALADLPLIGVHPNENTATVWLSLKDLEKVIKAHGNEILTIQI